MARLPGRPPERAPAYLEKFERLQTIGAPDDPILAELVAHERAIDRFAELEREGRSADALAVLRAHLDASHRAARVPDVRSTDAQRTRVVMPRSIAVGLAMIAAASIGALGATAASARVTSVASKDAYIKKADAICTKTQNKTDAIVEEAGLSPTDAEARVRADKVVALAQAEVAKLRALTPPRADVKKLAKVYDAIDAGWAGVADDPALLTEEPGPLAKATKLVSAYGFEVCGRG